MLLSTSHECNDDEINIIKKSEHRTTAQLECKSKSLRTTVTHLHRDGGNQEPEDFAKPCAEVVSQCLR